MPNAPHLATITPPGELQRRSALSPRVFVYGVTATAALAGFLFGFDTAVINGGLVFLRREFALTDVQTELAASSLLLGCLIGAPISGWLTDRFGRKRILISAGILFCISALAAALARDLTQFAAARLLGGVAIGVASTLAPIYIAEVSPAAVRGRLVSLNQLAIVVGILAAYLANWLLSTTGPSSWRLMFAVALLPSALFCLSLLWIPESPRWLMERGREAEAAAVLARILGPDMDAELQNIREALSLESGSWRDLLRPGVRRALLIGMALAVLQQTCGMNVVIYYGSLIFTDQLGSHSSGAALGVSVLLGLVNLAATVAALFLIDRVGRRPLLLWSAGLMGVGELVLGAVFRVHPVPAMAVIALLLICVAAFAIGLGPCMWALLSEFFPTRVRGRAMSAATLSLWTACSAMTATFLTLTNTLGLSGAFWLYGGFCLMAVVLTWRLVPETRGLSLEDIERLWLLEQHQTKKGPE